MKTKFDKLVKKLPFHLQQSLRQALIREKIRALFINEPSKIQETLEQFHSVLKTIKESCREMGYDYAKDRMFKPDDNQPDFFIEIVDDEEMLCFIIGIDKTNYSLEIRTYKPDEEMTDSESKIFFTLNKLLATNNVATTQQVVYEMENIGITILNSSFSALCEFLGKDPDKVDKYIQKLIKEDNSDMNRFLYEDLNRMMGITNELAIKKDIEPDDEWQ